ncbi:MAG: hypothetical protein HZB55_22355 [Deltaproteobacteria bacterium]|nr:hypothetical protein [Deltaproteobacteria bacterium]
MNVILDVGGVRLEGRLAGTPPALALARRLPLELPMERWGDEYYGDIGVGLGSFSGEKTELLEIGDLAYWEPGNALCLFFGPTPASRGPQPRAASPVFPVGHVEGDWSAVRALGPGVRIGLRGAG